MLFVAGNWQRKVKQTETILAIEAAIGGGSLAIIRRDGFEVSISGGISRAESILQQIEVVTDREGISLSDLNSIAVSLGPGSFTGIRIGIATALGLRRALSIECMGVSTLEAMAYAAPNQGRTIPVIPTGRNLFAVQEFDVDGNERTEIGDAEIVDESELMDRIEKGRDVHFVLHPEVVAVNNRLSDLESMRHLSVCDTDLATLIGRRAISSCGTLDLIPLYLRPRERSSDGG